MKSAFVTTFLLVLLISLLSTVIFIPITQALGFSGGAGAAAAGAVTGVFAARVQRKQVR